MDDESSDDQLTHDSNENSDDNTAGLSRPTYHIITKEGCSDRGLQTVALSNAPSNSSAGPTIIQYTPGSDGQYFIPVHQLNSSTVMSFSPGSIMVTSDGSHGDEAIRKRELRLLKNKEAAKECRRKKKEYVKCLENRVAVLENQNKTLIEELKSLKELYCQKDVHS
jgi:hypothetical protein